ncbi:hypothetical protein K1T71_009322 [Dendrolimus kikuchii]|uniref:Uncharacterized protein n=1 Tax=Dendrolimus kikuchii TaxID=765133 RepID=A0ACC1CUD2_9NEOP|nr:hypothetical protein K1T71_009322 [Dendrolimus kikuchii]
MTEYYHVVPWYNSAEWNGVYQELYSDSANKENVLNQLLIWKARCPSMPSGIESTLTLLQVYVQDHISSKDIATDQILRLAYSSAVMRFVNHMLDTETTKGSSLYQAAKNLGVPDWIIDLRHDTAHSSHLPSLQLLRDATLIGLDWLKKNYWEKHQPYVQDYISGQQEENVNDENKIAVLMNFCTSLSFCAHPNCEIKNLLSIPDPSMRESIMNDAKDLLGDKIDMSDLKTVSIKALIKIVNEQCKKFLKVNNTVHYVNKVLLDDDSLLLSFELLKFMDNSNFKKHKKLRTSYVHCFEVLLTYLHTNDLLLDFILALIKITQTKQCSAHRALLAAMWLSEILSALRRGRDFNEKINRETDKEIASKRQHKLKTLYKDWFPNEKSNLILNLKKPVPIHLTDINFIKSVVSTYNQYLTHFVEDLLSLVEPKLPAVVSEKICKLAKLISEPHIFPNQPATRIYTGDDLKSPESNNSSIVLDVIDENVNNNEDHVTGIWRIASENHSWGTCPIGQLPWEQSRNVDLQASIEKVQMEE